MITHIAEIASCYSFTITAYGDTTAYRDLDLDRCAEVLAGWLELEWRIESVVFEIEEG